MKPSTSHQSSNNHRLATSSLTLLASCSLINRIKVLCCGLATSRGTQRSRHQNLGRWSTKRPMTGHQLHTCSWIITGGRRAIPDGLMDGCSKRVMGVAVPRDPSTRNLVSSSQGSPLKGTPMATGDTSAAVASQPYLAIADCLLLLRRIMQSLHNMFWWNRKR